MTRPSLVLIGLALLTGCSGGGGGDSSTTSSPPPSTSTAQPDMLTATPQGLLRGKANGQGQQLLLARPHSDFYQYKISGDQVYYYKEAPSSYLDYPNRDIWSVRTDGTSDHAVINTPANEFVFATNGPVVMVAQSTYDLGVNNGFYSLHEGALVPLPIPNQDGLTTLNMIRGDRIYFHDERHISSINANGSGLLIHATVLYPAELRMNDIVEDTLIFREYLDVTGKATLQAAPITGGMSTSLDDGSHYVAYAGHVGARVISQRCAIDSNYPLEPRAGPCDVVSVHRNGSSPVVLASHSANETVQGVMDEQVIIRRNLSGNDQLIAVPVTGGAERLLMTMTDSEFVETVIDDLLIVRRPSGTWTLDLNAKLTQLGTVALDFNIVEVGSSVCGNTVNAVWCLPLDGQGPQVKIADTGRVVGVL